MKPFFAHISLPENTSALLFDMDGVLLDSLGLDIQIAGPLFSRHTGREVKVEPAFIKSIFAVDPARFVELILDTVEKQSGPVENRAALTPALREEYLHLRRTTPFALLPGVADILQAAAEKSFKLACVSNNPLAEVKAILRSAGLDVCFSEIIGNDMSLRGKVLAKKPAPDTYLYAAEKLGVKPENCAVFEDSALGCQAGLAAGMHVVGLLTGSAALEDLRNLKPAPQQVFPTFMEQAA